MTEATEEYINQLPFDETCDNYCNYIEDYKDFVGELTLQIEILNKENMSLKQVLTGIAKENKGYRDTVDRLKVVIEKYERGINDEPRKTI